MKATLVALSVLALAAPLAARAAQAVPTGSGAAAPAPQEDASKAGTLQDTLTRYRFASRPDTEHRLMESLVGSWAVTATWNVGGKKVHVTGVSENQFGLGGRFLECRASAGDGDTRVEALTLIGYDDRRSRFSVVAMNDLMSFYLPAWGTFDPARKSFIFHGKERDEVTGGVLAYRELLRLEGPDRHVVEYYLDRPNQAPVQILQATFTRR